MSYLVFARKYRPQTFEDVAGQAPVVTTLRNAIASGRIAHAFLFAGPRGVGKTTSARLLAKALNCANGPTAEPCGTCSSCIEVTEGGAMDVLEIDGASNRGIDDVKALRESVQYSPARDRYKVVIIDEVHMLSTPAFNALLKTLEEPPAHAKFIFATTEIHKVPATILSRCQVYEFRRIPFRETLARLRAITTQEKIEASDEALALIARHSDGCLRDAQSALDEAVAFGGDTITEEGVRSVLGLVGNDVVFEVADAILAEDAPAVLEAVDRLVDSGTDSRQFAARLGEHIRNLLVALVVEDPAHLIAGSESELARLREQAQGLSEEEALRLLNLLALGEEELKRSTAPRFTLERTLLKLVQSRRLRPLTDLIAGIAPGSASAAGSPSNPKAPTARPVAAPRSAPAATIAPPATSAPTATIANAAITANTAPVVPAHVAPPPSAPTSTRAAAAPPRSTSRPSTLTRAAAAKAQAASESPVVADVASTMAVAAPAARADSQPAAPARDSGPARARAEGDPSLRKLTQLFGGSIVDVTDTSETATAPRGE